MISKMQGYSQERDGWESVVSFLKNSSSPMLVVSHIYPDGDAIGSLIAFAGIAEQLGLRCQLALDDSCPVKYRFLEGWEEIRNLQKEPLRERFSRVVVLDAGAFHRIGAAREMIDSEAEILNIDHHHTIEPFGNVNWIFPEASATCEILFYLFKGLNIPITSKEANALFTGILTDTGRFRFSNTSSQALRICAELVECGVNPGWITENIYYNFPAEQMKALGVALQHLEFYSGGKIALMELPWAFATDDTEGFVEYATSIEGVMLGALITQMGPGEWKVSLRSRVSLDVSEIARFFGGGGHKKAAGFRYKGELERLKEELVSVLDKGLIKMEMKGSPAWISFHPEDECD